MQAKYNINELIDKYNNRPYNPRGSIKRVSIEARRPSYNNFQSLNNYQFPQYRNPQQISTRLGSDSNIRVSRENRVRDTSQPRKLSVSLVKGNYTDQIENYKYNQKVILPRSQNKFENDFQPNYQQNYNQYQKQVFQPQTQNPQMYNVYEPYQKMAEQAYYNQNKNSSYSSTNGIRKVSSLQNIEQQNYNGNSNYYGQNQTLKKSESDQKLQPLRYNMQPSSNYQNYDFKYQNLKNNIDQNTQSTLNTEKQDDSPRNNYQKLNQEFNDFYKKFQEKRNNQEKVDKTRQVNRDKSSKHQKPKRSILRKSKNLSKSCKKVQFNENLNEQKNVSKYIKAEMQTIKRPLFPSLHDSIFYDEQIHQQILFYFQIIIIFYQWKNLKFQISIILKIIQTYISILLANLTIYNFVQINVQINNGLKIQQEFRNFVLVYQQENCVKISQDLDDLIKSDLNKAL